MTSTHARNVGALAAVLLFWTVGAYNRMVSLRNAVAARFASVDELLQQRRVLLERQIEAVAATLSSAGPRLDALRAASRQADAARDHARSRPSAAGAVTSLRVAEEILADARARLPVQTMAGADLPDIHARLAAGDGTLAFARREFNAAVVAYNAAVRQFPTALVARLFGFRPGATL